MNAPTEQPVLLPTQERANHNYLVWDVFWFGLAAPALWRFMGVYAVRIGSTPMELGWLSALPSIALMLAASLASWWRNKHSSSVQALFWPSFVMRFRFLLPAFTPLLPVEWQPWWLILSSAVPCLADGIASTIFIVMLREAVTPSRLAALLSHRTMTLNITFAFASIALGLWLKAAPFPLNYQIMFIAGFAGGLLSLFYVARIRVPQAPAPSPQSPAPEKGPSPWRSPAFYRVAILAILMHIPVFFLVSVFNLRLIREMGADEAYMSIFGLVELVSGAIMAMFAARILKRLGTQTTVALSMVGMSLSALIVAVSPSLTLALLSSALGGASWAVAGIGLFSNFSQSTPTGDMTRYSTAYHQVIFLSTFIGPMLGSALANASVPLATIMLLGAGLRLVAGAITQWGLSHKEQGDMTPAHSG